MFEEHLMFEGKVIEDPLASLHVGKGLLPDWLHNKKGLLPLDTYDDKLYVFRWMAVHRGAHCVHNTKNSSLTGR